MNFRPLLIAACLGLCSTVGFGQVPTPAPPQESSVLIYNGKAHLGNGEYLVRSAILMDSGRIKKVFDLLLGEIDTNQYERVIDATGKQVYPGFIAANSILGLTEIGAVRSSHDYADVGDMNPNVRTLTVFNTDSRMIPTVRSNGVLISQPTPRSGTLSGTSSVMQLDAWNWEDAVLRKDDGVHLNWPRQVRPGAKSDKKKDAKKASKAEEIKTFFEQARAYAEVTNRTERNLRFEAMRGIFEGTQNLYIHADRAQEILEAITFVRELKLKNVVLVGGHDAWLLADQLKDNRIPVILRRVHSLPLRADEDVDLPYRLPAMLHEADVPFALAYEGDMEAMGVRNLAFTAGTAAAYGLPYEEAVKAITLAPARILGIAKRVGSIEEDKDATLFISTGDALDMRTNEVTHAFIQGRQIDLDNHQKQLYEKFRGH